jgi:hypothetical protein
MRQLEISDTSVSTVWIISPALNLRSRFKVTSATTAVVHRIYYHAQGQGLQLFSLG